MAGEVNNHGKDPYVGMKFGSYQSKKKEAEAKYSASVPTTTYSGQTTTKDTKYTKGNEKASLYMRATEYKPLLSSNYTQQHAMYIEEDENGTISFSSFNKYKKPQADVPFETITGMTKCATDKNHNGIVDADEIEDRTPKTIDQEW